MKEMSEDKELLKTYTISGLYNRLRNASSNIHSGKQEAVFIAEELLRRIFKIDFDKADTADTVYSRKETKSTVIQSKFVVKKEEKMESETKNVFWIDVQFKGNNFKYTYKHVRAVEVGKRVVVNSPYDGYVLVTVVGCKNANTSPDVLNAHKWIVSEIDDIAYKHRTESDKENKAHSKRMEQKRLLEQ